MKGTLAKQERIDSLRNALAVLPHGSQTDVVKDAARELGVSVVTIYNQLRARGWSSGRKLRADKGDDGCPISELHIIASVQHARPRANGKIICSAKDAISIARENGMVKTTLSDASVMRLLRKHGLDSATLSRPSPHTSTQSRHPNHVWQLDSSICVLYYLRGDKGLQVMREDKFNIRKPDELAKVMNERVLRYCCTDHTSGSVYARYFLTSGENQKTVFEFLMMAWHQQPGRVMHGVPFILEMDMAAANMSHAISNLCDQLGVKVIAHAPGNPRANGQVEQAHNMIETGFEARLALKRIETIDALNADLDLYLADLNNRRIHSRHGQMRSAIWQMIGADELRICPPVERCQQLMMSDPETRQVQGDMHIEYTVKGYKKAWYLVSHVEGLLAGDRVQVSVNPYREPEVFVRVERTHGPMYYACQPRPTNQYGFFVDAPMRGESYAAQKETASDIAHKAIDQAAWGTSDRLKKMKAMSKGPAFGGLIDPMKDLVAAKAEHPAFMQRRGVHIDLVPTVPEVRVNLSFHELLRALRGELNRAITPDENTYLRSLTREFTDDDVATLAAELRNPARAERPRLVAVK